MTPVQRAEGLIDLIEEELKQKVAPVTIGSKEMSFYNHKLMDDIKSIKTMTTRAKNKNESEAQYQIHLLGFKLTQIRMMRQTIVAAYYAIRRAEHDSKMLETLGTALQEYMEQELEMRNFFIPQKVNKNEKTNRLFPLSQYEWPYLAARIYKKVTSEIHASPEFMDELELKMQLLLCSHTPGTTKECALLQLLIDTYCNERDNSKDKKNSICEELGALLNDFGVKLPTDLSKENKLKGILTNVELQLQRTSSPFGRVELQRLANKIEVIQHIKPREQHTNESSAAYVNYLLEFRSMQLKMAHQVIVSTYYHIRKLEQQSPTLIKKGSAMGNALHQLITAEFDIKIPFVVKKEQAVPIIFDHNNYLTDRGAAHFKRVLATCSESQVPQEMMDNLLIKICSVYFSQMPDEEKKSAITTHLVNTYKASKRTEGEINQEVGTQLEKVLTTLNIPIPGLVEMQNEPPRDRPTEKL